MGRGWGRGSSLGAAESDAVVNVLKQVFNQKDITFISDARTNSVVVQANAVQMQQVQQIVAQLDKIRLQPAGHVRRLGVPRPRARQARLRRAPIDIQVLDDGSVEVRAPTDTDYWVRAIATRKGARVSRGDALLLVDASNEELQAELEQEVQSLRLLLAEAEALARLNRDGRTEDDKQTFAKATKRASAIRAGISEKTRTLYQLKNSEGVYPVTAEIDGVVTFIADLEEDLALEPNQLLVRITPE